MWNKKPFLTITLLLLTTSAFAHSGRLDGQGGHRANKEWVYDGKWIEIKDNNPELKDDKKTFMEGDYHFHCKPSANKVNAVTLRDGIYIPAQAKEVITSNIKVSGENVVASKNSELYHKPGCKHIKNIKEENIIIFEDKEDAEKSGYTADKSCQAGGL